MGPWMVLPVKVYELNITHSKFLFALWLLSTKCLLCLLLKIHHVSADDVMWREDMEDVDKWGFAASDSFDYVLKWGESGCKSPSHVGDNVGTWSCDMWLQLLQSLQLDCVEHLHLQLVGTPLLAACSPLAAVLPPGPFLQEKRVHFCRRLSAACSRLAAMQQAVTAVTRSTAVGLQLLMQCNTVNTLQGISSCKNI